MRRGALFLLRKPRAKRVILKRFCGWEILLWQRLACARGGGAPHPRTRRDRSQKKGRDNPPVFWFTIQPPRYLRAWTSEMRGGRATLKDKEREKRYFVFLDTREPKTWRISYLLNKPTFGLFTRQVPRSFIKAALFSRFYEIQTLEQCVFLRMWCAASVRVARVLPLLLQNPCNWAKSKSLEYIGIQNSQLYSARIICVALLRKQ